jgi:uncharacterized membrane protein
MTVTTDRPPATRRRIIGVDAARGIALIGMMSIHVTPAVYPDGDLSVAYLLASGRASALFAVLAGVGLALAYGGESAIRGRALTGAAASIGTRAGILILVGLILGGLDSGVAVILVYYGLLFIVAIPFLRFSSAVLLPLAALWAVAVPVLSYQWRTSLPPSTYQNMSMDSFSDPTVMIRELLLTGYYPVLPWIAYLLAGMGIGRLALRSPRIAVWLAGGGAALAALAWGISWWLINVAGGLDEIITAGVGRHPVSRIPFTDGVLTSSFAGTSPTTSWWWMTLASPHTATPFDLLHTIGTATAVIGVMLLVARVARGLVWPLAAIGSMTFTLYTLHVLLLAGPVPRETNQVLLIHVLIAFAFAVPWRAFIGRGPLESLTASLSSAARAAVTRG